MLALHYHRQNEQTLHYRTEKARVVIGRGPGNDLLLADSSVSRRHCRIAERGRAWIIEDLGSTNGTRINGWPILAPVEVAAGNQLELGVFTMVLAAVEPRSLSVEDTLLEAIADGDVGSRLVYADWLEEHGEGTRAEFLRLLQAIIDAPMATPADKAASRAISQRLRELADSIDLAWRMRVAHVVG